MLNSFLTQQGVHRVLLWRGRITEVHKVTFAICAQLTDRVSAGVDARDALCCCGSVRGALGQRTRAQVT